MEKSSERPPFLDRILAKPSTRAEPTAPAANDVAVKQEILTRGGFKIDPISNRPIEARFR